jgi:hypothetical protein
VDDCWIYDELISNIKIFGYRLYRNLFRGGMED